MQGTDRRNRSQRPYQRYRNDPVDIYRHLRELARSGHVVQVSRGRWRARTTEEPSP